MSSSRRGAKAQQEWREFVASLPAEACLDLRHWSRMPSSGPWIPSTRTHFGHSCPTQRWVLRTLPRSPSRR